MVKTESRSTKQLVWEIVFIVLAVLAVLTWLALLILAGFFRHRLDNLLLGL